MINLMRAWVATPLGEDEAAGGALIWVSGHNALRQSPAEGEESAEGQAQVEGFEAQFSLAMQRLERTLHEAGASWGDIVSARAYVPEPDDIEALQARLGEFMREPRPALTILCSQLRPGLLFEIECVAVRPRPNLHVGG